MTKLLLDEPDVYLEIVSDDFASVQESKEEKIKNHITPIKTCVDLILAGNMGVVSPSQKKNFELIKSELEKVTDLLQTSQNKIIVNSTKHEFIPQEEKTEFLENVPHSTPKIANNHKRVTEKNYQVLALTVLTGLIILVGTSLVTADGLFEESNELVIPTSKYIIENLKGDTIDVHKYWKTIPGEPLYVNIINSANLPEEKLQIVKDTILSTEFHEIDDNMLGKAPKGTMSKYYLGWKGALSTIEQETENHIPKKFEIISSSNGAGDIIITLTNKIDGDGTAGITKSTVHGDQILKSEITIYNASSLSDRTLEKVSRHEFGHAMGLAHSTAPEDLMYYEIRTPYPFISDCNISAIAELYDGKVDDKVICKK